MTEPSTMEPMLPGYRDRLSNLAFELVAEANRFEGSVQPALARSIGDLVRSMNCYYSNLIEGHATQLVDIERALHDDYSEEPKKRNLQLEAKAHIDVQRMLDRGKAPSPVISVEGIRWIHGEFCNRLPDELLEMTDPVDGQIVRMVPGELRKHHVKVGRHEAPEPEALDALLKRFVEAYTSKMLSTNQRLMAIPAAHHRLAWIHPFMDGNGRVTRLLSHAMLREMKIGSEMWSVSRGLARQKDRYKALLQAADEPRRGERDRRGNLTDSGLASFCEFFLEVCIDQIAFMKSLLETSGLLTRIEVWAEEETRLKRLPRNSFALLEAAVLRGEFARKEAARLTGYEDRQARTVLSSLLDKGLLVSDSARGIIRLGIPSTVVERWFPGLYKPEIVNELSPDIIPAEPPEVPSRGSELATAMQEMGWQLPENFDAWISKHTDQESIRAVLSELEDASVVEAFLRDNGIDLSSTKPPVRVGRR